MTSATTAVRQQIAAMGCELFEVGVFRPETAGTDASMLLRVWGPDTLLHSVPWLHAQNHAGRHIYIRPKGEHNLSLVDDLTADALKAMDRDGFHPALVVETSPFNFQARLKHPEPLDKQLGTGRKNSSGKIRWRCRCGRLEALRAPQRVRQQKG